MKFHIKERAWTLREEFLIRDQTGQPVFIVKGKLFHITDNFSLIDRGSGVELAHIKQKMFGLTPHYEIQRTHEYGASLHEKLLHFGGERFKIRLDNGSVLHIDGNLWNWDFTVSDERGNLWAQISRRLSLFRDSYAVEIAQGVDIPFILALAITIEVIRMHQEEKGEQ